MPINLSPIVASFRNSYSKNYDFIPIEIFAVLATNYILLTQAIIIIIIAYLACYLYFNLIIYIFRGYDKIQ